MQDWQAAFKQAPLPCSQRSALQTDPCQQRQLSQHTSPAFWRSLADALAHLHRCSVPMAPELAQLASSIQTWRPLQATGSAERQAGAIESDASQLQVFKASVVQLLHYNQPPLHRVGQLQNTSEAADDGEDLTGPVLLAGCYICHPAQRVWMSRGHGIQLASLHLFMSACVLLRTSACVHAASHV